MDWIKKHTDQFALALVALVLLALSVLVFLKTQGFAEGFGAALEKPPHSKEIDPVDTTKIKAAEEKLANPKIWAPKLDGSSLFVSKPMIQDKEDPTKILIVGKGSKQHPPVPDAWLLKYKLDILSPTVLTEDPDGDGFTNLDEYLGPDRSPENGDADSTDPQDKDSHPPYYTKLYLRQWVPIPFRLLFQAYDADPAKPKEATFQINTVDRGRKTEFVKLGERVPNTSFLLEKFEKKTRINPKIQEEEDVSELTVKNTDTDETVVLVLATEKPTLSPESYAIFDYYWPDQTKPLPIKVKKRQEFVLKPNVEEKYKLVDSNATDSLIQLPGGDKTYKVIMLPKK